MLFQKSLNYSYSALLITHIFSQSGHKGILWIYQSNIGKGNTRLSFERDVLEQGWQTHFHQAPHQPDGCLQRAECNFNSLTVREKLHLHSPKIISAFWRQPQGSCGPCWKWVCDTPVLEILKPGFPLVHLVNFTKISVPGLNPRPIKSDGARNGHHPRWLPRWFQWAARSEVKMSTLI